VSRKLPESTRQAAALSVLFAAFIMIFGIAIETFAEDGFGIGSFGKCTILFLGARPIGFERIATERQAIGDYFATILVIAACL
jgi:hypothetical protein